MVTNTQDEEDSQDSVNYKAQYRNLKRKLKFLIYVSSLKSSNKVSNLLRNPSLLKLKIPVRFGLLFIILNSLLERIPCFATFVTLLRQVSLGLCVAYLL